MQSFLPQPIQSTHCTTCRMQMAFGLPKITSYCGKTHYRRCLLYAITTNTVLQIVLPAVFVALRSRSREQRLRTKIMNLGGTVIDQLNGIFTSIINGSMVQWVISSSLGLCTASLQCGGLLYPTHPIQETLMNRKAIHDAPAYLCLSCSCIVSRCFANRQAKPTATLRLDCSESAVGKWADVFDRTRCNSFAWHCAVYSLR